MKEVSLSNLPVELLYGIFNYLDTKTILRSLRPVCKWIYAATETYHKFSLNFTSMSQSDIVFITTHLVPLSRIRSIIFSDTDKERQKEIQFFLSQFRMQDFSGLASILCGSIDEQSRQTLSILSASVDEVRERYTQSSTLKITHRCFTSSLIASGAFLSSLSVSNLNDVARWIFSPCQNTLQHLTFSFCTYVQYQVILRSLPNLRTMKIDYCVRAVNTEGVQSSAVNETHQKLKFLTIHNCQLPVEYFNLFFSLTPSLVYLKLVSARMAYGSVFDGSFWEKLIRARLPQLQQFKFFFVCFLQSSDTVPFISSIIDTFRTPFWLGDKHWHATCDHVVNSSAITLYTTPFRMNDGDILVRYKASPVSSGHHLFKHRTNKESTVIAEETLTELNLSRFSIGDLGAQCLANELQDSTILTAFYLRFNGIGEEGARSLALILQRNIAFTTLDLEGNRINEEGLEELALTLRNSTTLTTLHLKNNEIGPSGARYLAELIRIHPTLRVLDLQLNQIKDQGAKYLADGLKDNNVLTTLNLRFNRIGKDGARFLASALERNMSLTTLDLGGNPLIQRAIKFLADALKQNTTLTTLNLSANSLEPEDIQYLAVALPDIRTLSTLDLSNNAIMSRGARAIGDNLASNTSLRELQLCRNNIEDDGGQSLVDALRNNTRLLTFDLSDNSISDTTMQTIDQLLLRNSQLDNSN